MLIDPSFIMAGIMQARMDADLVHKMRENLSKEDFEKWQDERTAERRHRELCQSIERAGKNASFWSIL